LNPHSRSVNDEIELTGGWHLLRVEIGTGYEWIICDPQGDRLGNTEKHKAEFDAAMVAPAARQRP